MKVIVGASQDTYIHNTLHNTAYHFKKRLDEHHNGANPIEGSFLEKMACLTFLAFTVEAHANFVGDQRKLEGWNERDNWKKKLKRIFKGAEPDWNKHPFSTVCQLFMFRDQLAHGKPFSTTLSETEQVYVNAEDQHKVIAELAAPWEKLEAEIDYNQAYEAVDLVWQQMMEIYGMELIDTTDGGGGWIKEYDAKLVLENE